VDAIENGSLMAKTAASAPERLSARDRLLAAADELFYAEGIQSVGIDKVIEHAGVAKASLYSAFGSKEALVGAYLDARGARLTQRLDRAVESQSEPREQILAVFDAQAELARRPGFRGCAFVAASAEAPPGGLVEQATVNYRSSVRRLFTDLATRAGAAAPATLACQLQALYDGASVAARLDHSPESSSSTRAAAAALIDASTA
jgi:AcrR family transcriptional regulator